MNARDLLLVLLALAAGLLLGGDLVVHRHGHFPVEARVGFHVAVSALGCLAVVLGGRLLGRLTGRREDYYD